MKKLFFLIAIVVLSIVFYSCNSTIEPGPQDEVVNNDGKGIYFLGDIDPPEDYDPCVTAYETDLIVADEGDIYGQNGENVGTVSMTNGNDFIYVTYKLNPDYASNGYYFSSVQTHFWTGGVGKYRRSEGETFDNKTTTEYTLVIPKDCDDCDDMLPMFYEIDCDSEIKLINYASVCNDEGSLEVGLGTGFINQEVAYVRLIAGEDIHVGFVTVKIQDEEVVMEYNTINDWSILNVKFHLAKSLSDIPTSSSGRPLIGSFDYAFDVNSTNFSHSIPISELNFELDCDEELFIAAYADVNKLQQEESAWGEGYCFEENDCYECEGKVTELTLKYLGDEDAYIVVEQKKEGNVYEGTVSPGEEFTFTGKDKKGTLGTEIKIFVDDKENTKIHTSCSQPIGPGLIKGDFEVIEGYSKENGLLCPVENDEDDCECDGKVTELTLEYLGDEEAYIVVEQKKEGNVYEGTVSPGEEFTFTGKDKNGTLGTEITIFVDDDENTKIHTSCSQPIGPGLIKGDFKVIEGYSRNNGLLCPLDGDSNDDGNDDDNNQCKMYFTGIPECGSLNEPECLDAFGYSDYRICHIEGIYPNRTYYWTSAGYIFCCDKDKE